MTTGSDEADRIRALTDLDATLLVEAAAGTGKTSLLAGRLTLLLASGVPPRNIAAITFTELAAGELRARVGRFIAELLGGIVSPDLRLALPDGLTPSQELSLEESRLRLDELTATTIHGFCHSLLRSYAIEANIDPGAEILEAVQTDLAFRSVFERWLRRRLGENARPVDPVAVMAKRDPSEAVDTLKKLGKFRREFRSSRPLPSDLDDHADGAFVESVREFRRWFNGRRGLKRPKQMWPGSNSSPRSTKARSRRSCPSNGSGSLRIRSGSRRCAGVPSICAPISALGCGKARSARLTDRA
jgi:CRISPR-associated exonuclease Cas4